ncbi:MAG TPA: aldehyde dehydrogenase family protein [Marmoricola sp.]|jgi:succinate-semialdehyde dehydrogenase/glutarate-semialdehyde dehydrogenase|nr:aldehyde dehydrogenase family protein [Marmoricola sp.]
MRQARLLIDGEWVDGASTTELLDKYDGSVVAEVHEADQAQVDQAVAGVAVAQKEIDFPHFKRYEVLIRAAGLLQQRTDLVGAIVDDTGFTLGDAEREISRAVQTLTTSGEEAKRIHGEMVPLHGAPGGAGRLAFTVRHPVGVVAAITPFNSPLNTVAHKVGPALAAGNGVVLKPAAYTPLTAGILAEVLLEAGLPARLLSVLNGSGSKVGEWLLQSQIPAFYAFTGSTGVGTHIRQAVGLRKTQLELGSLASTIVCADADLARAASACVGAAFRKAGQVCTSIQRLYVERSALDEFGSLLAADLGGRAFGDPRQPGAFVGPVISSSDADRIESWIEQARDKGAEVVAGGKREGQVIAPTVLAGVDPATNVFSQEVFGPVVNLVPFDEFDAALADVDDTPFGLAAGIFTRDIGRALTAAERLRMGSVHINETSSSRVDLMPYGGVKESGSGVEGPRYAIEEMTEQRLITIGRP